MKKLFYARRVDLYLQLLALIVPGICALITGNGEIFFLAYFTVGAAQIVSCLVNKIKLGQEWKSSQRRYYERILLSVVVVFLVLLAGVAAGLEIAIASMMMFAFIMLFLGFIMAIWYMMITVEELAVIRKCYGNKNTNNTTYVSR